MPGCLPGEDRKLYGAAPLLAVLDPLAVRLIRLAQKALGVLLWAACHRLCYHPPAGRRTHLTALCVCFFKLPETSVTGPLGFLLCAWHLLCQHTGALAMLGFAGRRFLVGQ